MKFEKKYLWTLIASTSLVLAACGSNGKDSGSSTDNNGGGNNNGGGSTETPNRVSLTGLAVKGVMANATITVSSLDGSTTYDTTTTGSDGTYSLADMDLPLNTALLVTMTTNANTMLTCDSADGCTDSNSNQHAFGVSYSFNDPDFKMTAVLAPMTAENASLTLMVTPVTHMAAERVMQTGATTTEAITAVNVATANLLGLNGVDIATAIPADITQSDSAEASSASQKYGALVAGFASAAASTGKSITEVVSSVADSYADQGGMVANSSDDSTVDLSTLFTGAASSAAAANLTATESLYLVEAEEAESAEEDQWIEADANEEAVASTQAEAVTNAVALLESLNDWSDAMNAAGDDLTAFADEHANQLNTLMPAFDDQSQVLRGVRELLISDETYPLCEYDWNTDTEVCSGSVTVPTPGDLLLSTQFLGGLISMIGYVNVHSEVLQPTNTADEYTVSAMDLIDAGVNLDELTGFLTNADGDLEGDLVLTINDAGISISGWNGTGATIDSGTFVSGFPTEGELIDSALVYDIQGLSITGADGETFNSDGRVIFNFNSETERDNFLSASTDSTLEASLASMNVVTLTLDSSVDGIVDDTVDGFVQQTGVLSSNIVLTRDDAGAVVAAATVEISVKPTDSTASDEVVSGTLTFSATGTHTETGSADTFYIQSFVADSMSLSFSGEVQVENSDGAKASFDGLAVFGVDNTDGSAGLLLNGTAYVASDYPQADGSSVPGELSFTGTIQLGAEASDTLDGTTFLQESTSYNLTSMVVNGQLVATYYGAVEALNLDLTAAVVRDLEDGSTAIVANLDASAYGYEDGTITIAAEETADENITGGLVFSYGNQAITLSLDSLSGLGDVAGNNLMVTDGVTSMMITATCASATIDSSIGTCADSNVEYAGSIYSAGFEVGTVEERDGLPVFVFNDGSSYNLVVTPSFLISANQ
ncbi:hypothetical protein [Parathalassolituus penaei]|uniref:Carboxypeptidase regulatory-like domain-containing protein n=1 Tax=Parathalassolituus penaei TaxID=2997323 RepID=A0A9X3ECD1_9GAMM|nr:hypothetical protein [Parathalassolituus penaei]MCY0964992.1 hypothetical protein [Parathalassolituus penaei]